MILDGHIHISRSGTQPGNIKENIKAAGVEGGILCSICPDSFSPDTCNVKMSAIKRLDNLMQWTEINSNLYPFFWLDPTEEDALEQVEISAGRGVMGYKIICNSFYPYDESAVKAYKAIAELGKPVLFHSGILWDGSFSSIYNRPAGFEVLLEIRGLRFALAHVSWPWVDECIAVYGKFLHAKESSTGKAAEMFIDITPGTPPIYRQEALSKLFTVGYSVENNILFGTDNIIDSYDSRRVAKILELDNGIYDGLSISAECRCKIYAGNLKRFIGLQ